MIEFSDARGDGPGALHHVTLRGVNRRAIYERRSEARYFLSLVAKLARWGWWKVHCYSLLHTHFHLLPCSRKRSLSHCMHFLLWHYARWFNDRREREGPLFTGRFRSRPIRSRSYLHAVIGYIDRNPLEAGLTTDITAYPYGSAKDYARDKGPPWLSRSVVQGAVCDVLGLMDFDPSRYQDAFGSGRRVEARSLVEARMKLPAVPHDPLDYLLDSSRAALEGWLAEHARLADGSITHPPLVSDTAIENAVRDLALRTPDWRPPERQRTRRNMWTLVLVGSLATLARLSGNEIARQTGLGKSRVYGLVQEHKALCEQSPSYRGKVALVLELAMHACHGHDVDRPAPGSSLD